ncbi:MAG: class I SAM-dependent methyltransferase, partial [Solirubrobacterales bacterium]|nr:class I SAM-dependent methyltransferase [Solirubrobacterales bacterium]
PEPAALATANLRELGLDNVEVRVGRFQDELAPALADLGTVGHAFIDGHHDEEATLEYLELIRPHLAPGATVVFDDIDWSDGMRRAWRTVLGDARVDIGVDLGDVGLVVIGADEPEPVRVEATVV